MEPLVLLHLLELMPFFLFLDNVGFTAHFRLTLHLVLDKVIVCVAGGGMFVGCVVAGSVMLCCQGAKVRGALIRDVAAYAIVVVAVALILWSGQVAHAC